MFHDAFFVRSQKNAYQQQFIYMFVNVCFIFNVKPSGLTLKIKQIEITPELEIKLSVCYETLKSFSDVFCTYLQQKS